MSYFVFRNNTVERFFDKEFQFSGYDDVSVIPQEVDGYVWWYQIPIRFDVHKLAEEVNNYSSKLEFVLKHVNDKKQFIILTMDIMYSVPFTEDDYSLQLAVAHYNESLYQLDRTNASVKVLNITDFTRRYTSNDLFDWKFYFISQIGMNPKLNKDFKEWWKCKINSIALKRKKCIVLDLDNTLWGGVLGEDGVAGIKIGGDYPGKAFLYWQEALLELSKSGVILTVCSKNNEQDVLEAWEKNPYIVLKKEHFVAYRINWTDKATNICELAEELNIGLDSMVFIDDNPTERELVRQKLPMVAVPEFPEQPYDLPVLFKSLVNDYFKIYSVTEEDIKKTEQYKANAARIQSQKDFSDFGSFLESLNIKIAIETANMFNIPRIAQMTQKTNQFNLTTHRYTDTEVRGFVEKGWKVWCISVEDKFGDYGITGLMMIKPGGEIDTFLMSCRILGKGIELAFVKTMFSLLYDMGVKELTASYIPTVKNSQVKDFWESVGFTCVAENDDGIKKYNLVLAQANTKIETYYKISLNK